MSKNRRSSASSSRPTTQAKSKRTTIVTLTLLGSLTLTSVMLLVMATPPLTRMQNLVGISTSPLSFDSVYRTGKPIQAGRWNTIYIHHSRTRRGGLVSLAQQGIGAHFVIGNGDDCGDGEIQWADAWTEQRPARLGGQPLPAGQITICLVGDFDVSRPTDAQLQRLWELVSSLRNRLNLPATSIVALDRPGQVAGIGRNFPRR